MWCRDQDSNLGCLGASDPTCGATDQDPVAGKLFYIVLMLVFLLTVACSVVLLCVCDSL